MKNIYFAPEKSNMLLMNLNWDKVSISLYKDRVAANCSLTGVQD